MPRRPEVGSGLRSPDQPQRGAPGERWIAAVDIGATKTAVAVAALPLAWTSTGTLRRVTIPTPRDPTDLVRRLSVIVSQEMSARRASLAGLGVAAPGPLDREAGLIIHSPNLGWHGVPIGRMLQDALGALVTLDDDANLGALGEATWGVPGAAPASLVAYLTLSTGVGLGIATAGDVWRGAHGLAGEIGHLVVAPGGRSCSCGNRGCVEASLGGSALAEEWRRVSGGDDERADARALFRSARAGDRAAVRIVEDATAALATTLAIIATVLDPDCIVIGGSLALGQRAFVRAGARRAQASVLREIARTMIVARASLGGDSVLAGAATAIASQVAGRARAPPCAVRFPTTGWGRSPQPG